MSKFLRTFPTRWLLALLAGLVAAIAAGTAIAIAAAGSGPVPPPKPLAQAVHQALSAPMVKGITARISFTNHLISSSEIEGSNPILTGGSGRLWLAPNRLRVELQSSGGDAQLVVDNGAFWAYDPSSNTAYEGKLPAGGKHPSRARKRESIPSVSQIQGDLNRASKHLRLSGAIPGDIASRPAYAVRVSSRQNGGLLGAAQLAWDAVRGVPLQVAVYARGDSSPVLELTVTDISFGAVPKSDLVVSPPRGAKVVNVQLPTGNRAGTGRSAKRHGRKAHAEISGVAAVSRRLRFKLAAPARLAGLSRSSVTLLHGVANPAALVFYGRGLGGIAVIEQNPRPTSSQQVAGGDRRGRLNLPTVSINGVSGQELDTALGTMVRFTRGGVTYTVLGSVSGERALAAARGL